MIDKLNNLTREQKASKFYEEYYDDMDIPQEDKEKRIELAEEIDDIFFWLLGVVAIMAFTGEVIDTESLITSVQYRLFDIENVNVRYVSEHIVRLAGETVETTVERRDEEYFLSDERAMDIAAGEAHTFYEYEELQDAWENGKTMKTWHTQRDRRVRKSHAALDDKTIPITELFETDGSFLMVPRDSENGCSIRETANCRCYCSYS